MKRLIVILIAVMTMLLSTQVQAETEGPLTYERAVSLLNLNSGTLAKLKKAEVDSYEQYQSNVQVSQNTDVNGFTVTVDSKETYITYDAETRSAMAKMKEFGPEQFKFYWESSRDNRKITENTLETSLRGIFLGLYTAQNNLQLKQKQLSLSTILSEQSALKLKAGIISGIDLEESDYNLLKAQKDVDAASRNYDNAVRSFNQFVSLPLKTGYPEIQSEKEPVRSGLQPVETYISTALAHRFDILNIQRQLALKQLDKKLTEASYAYKTNSTERDNYDRLLNDIDQLNLDLEGMKLIIIDEIKNAYVDVISSDKSLDSMYNTVKLQRGNYEKMQARYKSGMASKNLLMQTELGLLQIENSYKAMLFDYKTKIMRFNHATDIGPGY